MGNTLTTPTASYTRDATPQDHEDSTTPVDREPAAEGKDLAVFLADKARADGLLSQPDEWEQHQTSPRAAPDTDAGLRVKDAFSERENRWRLEEILLVCEHQLQQMTQKVWDSRTPSPAPMSLPPFQRSLLTSPIDTWDVSMCNAVLRQLNGLKNKSDAAAVTAIANARNLCAHAAGGRVTTAKFEHHKNACMRAFTALGGDIATLHKLRTCEVDPTDLGVLACSREATCAAESEKCAGNRCFRENNFEGARECYTRGLQIAGAVSAEVRSQLHNNRATTNIRLKDFAQAKEDAKHACELAPQWAKPHLRLAEIYYETHKHHKAVARLEIAHGHATAAQDTAVLKEVTTKLVSYRIERNKSARRESENLAYGPMFEMGCAATRAAAQARLGMNEAQDPMALLNKLASLDMDGTGMEAKKHVALAQIAQQDGRLNDAAREFMAAAVAGDPEGMYNYAVCQMNGRGTRKNIAEAVRWWEKAASMPITDSPEGKLKQVGIGEAMCSLAELYDHGIYYAQDKSQARKYWERSAELNVNSGLNNFGICLKNGSHGVKKDLPRARELFRRSAELLFNPAMSNLGLLHASLLEYETAARWADAAFKFGFLPAADEAKAYRQFAKKLQPLAPVPQPVQDAFSSMATDTYAAPDFARKNEVPTLDTLRAIGSPYGDRLFAAKQLIADAMEAFHSSFRSSNADRIDDALNLAVQAHRIDDSELVFSQEEISFSGVLANLLRELGLPFNADLALLSKPSDASSSIAFWKSFHLRFPDDLAITKRAACMHMFTAYAGNDIKRGLKLFQRAFSLLPQPNDDSDPHTLDLLYLAGVAYFQTLNLQAAEKFLTRFLKYAPTDGHRKGAEAHYFLGMIAMTKAANRKNKSPGLETSLMTMS